MAGRRVHGPASKTPIFDALIAEAQRTKPESLIPAEDLDRRRPLTAQDRALAREYRAALESLEAEQDADVTVDQVHLLNAILVAARSLRNGQTLADWATYSGLPETDIRAAAVALRAVGLPSELLAR